MVSGDILAGAGSVWHAASAAGAKPSAIRVSNTHEIPLVPEADALSSALSSLFVLNPGGRLFRG